MGTYTTERVVRTCVESGRGVLGTGEGICGASPSMYHSTDVGCQCETWLYVVCAVRRGGSDVPALMGPCGRCERAGNLA